MFSALSSPRLRVGSFRLFLWLSRSPVSAIKTNKLRNKVKNQAKTKSALHLINIADWLIHQYNSWPQFLVSDSVLLLLFGPKSLIGNIILISIVGDRGSHNRKSMSLESEKPRFKFWICHSLPVWIQVSYLTSQSLNILICKLEL